MNISRHDANLAFAWLNDAWAVGANKSCPVLRFHDRLDLDHIKSGDTLSDAHYEVHLSLDGFKDSVSSERRRNVNYGRLGISYLLGLCYRTEDRQTKVLSACLALVDATDNLSAISKSLLSVESSLISIEKI